MSKERTWWEDPTMRVSINFPSLHSPSLSVPLLFDMKQFLRPPSQPRYSLELKLSLRSLFLPFPYCRLNRLLRPGHRPLDRPQQHAEEGRERGTLAESAERRQLDAEAVGEVALESL